MNTKPDVFTITFQHVTDTANSWGFDVHRKPSFYILLCDAKSEYGDAVKFPDNAHGYTEALAWLEEVFEKEEIES